MATAELTSRFPGIKERDKATRGKCYSPSKRGMNYLSTANERKKEGRQEEKERKGERERETKESRQVEDDIFTLVGLRLAKKPTSCAIFFPLAS